METRMKILFMGTPTIAQTVLESIEPYVNIVGVYTRPDKPAGRGQKEQYSPVKIHAIEKGYPIEQPRTLRTEEAIDNIRKYNPDCIVVVAYGALIPEAILAIPDYGVINIHGSLLPYYRGAAPIQRALWNGEKITGATIMQLDAGMDTGPILLTSSFPIEYTDTTYTLMQKMADTGSRALLRTLSYYMIMKEYPSLGKEEQLVLVQKEPLYSITHNDVIEDYVMNPQKQDDSKASYAKKMESEEELIQWNRASETHHQIQALSYSTTPTASSILYRDNTKPLRVKIPLGTFVDNTNQHEQGGIILGIEDSFLCIACNYGIYRLSHIRPENKKTMTAQEFYNGYCKGKGAYFSPL